MAGIEHLERDGRLKYLLTFVVLIVYSESESEGVFLGSDAQGGGKTCYGSIVYIRYHVKQSWLMYNLRVFAKSSKVLWSYKLRRPCRLQCWRYGCIV